MNPIRKLTDSLARLPGLGPRAARRAVQYLLAHGQDFREQLAADIVALGSSTAQCARCMRYDNPAPGGLCSLCADTRRDAGLLMVVEHDVDIDAVEATSTYRGYYFVLGGLLQLSKRRTEPTVRTSALMARVTREVSEVIFALSTTPEGDFTAKELTALLHETNPQLQTTLLGRGLSVGAELEYADPETIRSALKNRS